MRKIIIPTYGGIYKIVSLVNGKMYVGSAENFKKRWGEHLHGLRKGNHHCKYLRNAFNKYKEGSFAFKIIETIKDSKNLIEREQYWIDYYKSYDPKYGYNSSPTAHSVLGWKHNEESKRKISINNYKRWEDPEQKISASKKCKDRWSDPEFRVKTSKSIKDSINNPETKIKFSEARKTKWKDPEYRIIMEEIQKNRWAQPESKTIISEKSKDRWKDPILREKMIEGFKKAWIKRKENKN